MDVMIKKIRGHLPRAALGLAALSALGLLLSGPGCRLGLWDFRSGLSLLQFSALGGAAALLLALAALLFGSHPRGFAHGAAALLLAALTVAMPLRQLLTVRNLPYIHDISTDTEHPPEFVAILPLRQDAPNSAVYGGAELAAQQHKAYADVQPLLLNLPAPQAHARALSAARKMNWEIVAEDAARGRIEATATTLWFGFKDDVVVRIAPAQNGSRIDVRSVSRVGQSDVGANAARIRSFLALAQK